MKDNRKKFTWKRLFYSLAGLNLFIVTVLLLMVFAPSPKVEDPDKEFIEEEAGAEFTVNTTKANLNQLINAYMEKLFKGKRKDYFVTLEDDVQMSGSIKAFQTEIPISIRLEPIVEENGDMILKPTNISLGLLQLPNNKVLEYLKKNYPMPEWITVDPNKELIYVAVTQMEMKSNFKVKVEQFNPKNDAFSFKIKVPNKTLGL
ncbi:YpmS family protein [Aquibacillus sp. 3ASR75-11]|uniref:YpmS family protein n=1 Tax=Terrihalobacillus insolitus TaxID=2950438 RepID=A0A9X4APP7_9BACI|nr:YpmS family protein [Terrihalobacillus insolitus]MDC3425755.1 YpmS family protein [Terrihalobacillus insolitus]